MGKKKKASNKDEAAKIAAWKRAAGVSMLTLLDIDAVCARAVESGDPNRYEAALEYIQELVTCAVAQTARTFDPKQ